MPQRIQRKRTKGWRMPEGAVYVGRPGEWGNPYGVDYVVSPPSGVLSGHEHVIQSRAEAVELYERWLIGDHLVPRSGRNRNRKPPVVNEIRDELAGKDLVCWCPLDQPCHADVLLKIANGGAS